MNDSSRDDAIRMFALSFPGCTREWARRGQIAVADSLRLRAPAWEPQFSFREVDIGWEACLLCWLTYFLQLGRVSSHLTRRILAQVHNGQLSLFSCFQANCLLPGFQGRYTNLQVIQPVFVRFRGPADLSDPLLVLVSSSIAPSSRPWDLL